MTKATSFAEDNVKAALDLAQKLVRAKDVQESSGVADRVREVASRGDADAGEGARRHGAGVRHRGNQELETDSYAGRANAAATLGKSRRQKGAVGAAWGNAEAHN